MVGTRESWEVRAGGGEVPERRERRPVLLWLLRLLLVQEDGTVIDPGHGTEAKR